MLQFITIEYIELAGNLRRNTMKTIYERIKEYRNQLHLSQIYVANYLGAYFGNREIVSSGLP